MPRRSPLSCDELSGATRQSYIDARDKKRYLFDGTNFKVVPNDNFQ